MMTIYTRNTRVAASLTGSPFRIIFYLFLGLSAIVLLTTLTGCEFDNLKGQKYGPVEPGSDTTGTDTSGTTIGIAIAPTSIAIKTGETVQFTATVTGTTNQSVTWLITSGPGTIDATGRYQAPGSIATAAEIVTVKAVANADATVSATATLVVTPQTTGGSGGDTAKNGEICFQRDVLPIFQSNCAKSGCHDVITREEGYAFVDYDGIMRGIDPGDPGDSEIYEKITESDADDRMPPPPNPRLTSAQIATIRQWIQEGARNTICPPPATCDTMNVSYTGIVRPILDKYCIGCHGGSTPSKEINLMQYDQVRTVALDGRLHGVTARLTGYTPMPYNGDKLPDCEIKQLGAWANQGAQNN